MRRHIAALYAIYYSVKIWNQIRKYKGRHITHSSIKNDCTIPAER